MVKGGLRIWCMGMTPTVQSVAMMMDGCGLGFLVEDGEARRRIGEEERRKKKRQTWKETLLGSSSRAGQPAGEGVEKPALVSYKLRGG